MKQIVNIINFIRGCEPRSDMDLLRPVQEQIRLMKEHHLKGTFLIQYDAQIPVPIFRMLGSDQVYQYDFGL